MAVTNITIAAITKITVTALFPPLYCKYLPYHCYSLWFPPLHRKYLSMLTSTCFRPFIPSDRQNRNTYHGHVESLLLQTQMMKQLDSSPSKATWYRHTTQRQYKQKQRTNTESQLHMRNHFYCKCKRWNNSAILHQKLQGTSTQHRDNIDRNRGTNTESQLHRHWHTRERTLPKCSARFKSRKALHVFPLLNQDMGEVLYQPFFPTRLATWPLW